MERFLCGEKISEIIPFDYSSPVLFFPIRHHSPACSYHLLQAIQHYQPDCILVEGPENAEKFISVLTDENTVLPVAFYYFYKDSGKYISQDAEDYKCYYPFLSASPEYNALCFAVRNNIDCRFIDLPYGEILIHTAENKGLRKISEQQNYNDDRYLSENRFFQSLCEKTGMRSFEEFWENFFEIDALSEDTKSFVEKMYTYCYLTRQNTSDAERESDGCHIREKFMAENIRKAMETHKRVLVVTGGFHSYGLYQLLHSVKKPKKIRLHKFDEKTQNVYAIAYSFEAADALNGYASGMQNPYFYDCVWKNIRINTANQEKMESAYKDTVLELLLQCAKQSAKESLLITMADISSAVTMYEGLALLRNKKVAGLYELYDSVQSCFIKGEVNASSDIPLKILRRLATGDKIGKLCETAEKIPLITDFENTARKLRLKIESVTEQEIELDIFSKKVHMETSRFFYRMNFLETGFAVRKKGADILNNSDRSRIREVWSYVRTVHTDSALIDYSVYGSGIEEVCRIVLNKKTAKETDCGKASKLYVESFLMGITVSDSFVQKLEDILINDGNFFSVGKALYYFNLLRSLQKMYRTEKTVTEHFLIRCFQKIIMMLPSMITVKPEYSAECIKICRMLYNLVSTDLLHEEYENLFAAFHRMIQSDNPEPALYGAILGLLYGSDVTYRQTINHAVNGYLTGTDDKKKQGAIFIRGLFSTARDIVLVGDEFIRITDSLIKSLTMEEFMEVLPELRLAFSYFAPAETDSIAEKVALLYHQKLSEIQKSFTVDRELYLSGIQLEKEICQSLEGL